jgi:hypothetical protein
VWGWGRARARRRPCTHNARAVAGKWSYYVAGAYGSLAMAIFMVKTMKRVIFQETRSYGARGAARACRCAFV